MSVDTTRDPHPGIAPDDDHTSDGRCKYPATCILENRHQAPAEPVALDPAVARVTAALLETDALTANRDPSDGLYVVHEADVEHLVSTVLTLAAAQEPEVDPASFRAGYAAGQADAYAGAADAPGDLAAVATDPEWLRRLFDLPAPQRLAAASYYAAAAATAQTCFVENHEKRIGDATAQLDAARNAVEDAARVNAEARAEVRAAAAATRAARPLAAERGWDGAADRIAAHNKPLAQALRDANPHRDHGTTDVYLLGHAEPVATFPNAPSAEVSDALDDLAWTERLHDAVGVTDDQEADQ